MKALFLRWVHDRRGEYTDVGATFLMMLIVILLSSLLSVVQEHFPALLEWIRSLF